MALKGRQVTVVGGGVAGLAAARALALRGAQVTVFEQAAEIAEVGAGIQISPNGLCALQALGLGEAIRSVGLRAEAVALTDGLTGRPVVRLDLTRASGAYLLLHRARLIEVLERGAREAGVAIRLGAKVVVGEMEGDVVVAADGARSAFRAKLNGEAAPDFAGQVAWRTIIPDDGDAPVARVFLAPGQHLVSYPLPGGLRNIGGFQDRTEWAAEGWRQDGDVDAFRRAFRELAGPVQDWLARASDVKLWGLHLRPVAERWYNGRVVLTGDAAHPTLPYLAQGANMALEDAWALAACLDGGGGMAAYQAMRAPRVRRVVAAAAANARNYHLRGPMRFAAHTALRLGGAFAPSAPLKRFEWLYDYDVAADVR